MPQFSNCYQRLHGQYGKVTSYGYPFGYENDRNCIIQLSVPKGTQVCLKFEDFETDECCDIVLIYDGAKTSGFPSAM
ncbi:unnamed protein product [Gongylonema pulchrum]|uniref:CUB domain-containing protein n=1 Tax=Gongylonema pulchrum TaxID=637853 RepID=A0A3P6R9G7_9BILA|nr:unnamed protein product [Gongylonema pulchrum]